VIEPPARHAVQVGSPPGEADRYADEDLREVRLTRRFALAAYPVTRADLALARGEAAGPEDPLPAAEVTWADAARYCNWLSQREGLPRSEWCFHDEGRPYPDALDRGGYRLPTEAEWEYACRAGARTSRYYGSDEDLLPQYAHYARRGHVDLQPVGRLKPNDLGLFDMLGLVWEWCLNPVDVGPEAVGVLRGGSAALPARFARCAARLRHPRADSHTSLFGLRVARTLR
jgi:formylglycine-generating enzyme required for sulfatase activity